MSDKILQEAFDKMKAIEEGIGVQSGEDIMDGIEEFEEIQVELFSLIERLTDCIRGYAPDKERYWSSYGLAQLKIIAGSEDYASRDESLESLINELKSKAQDADDRYDEDERTQTQHAGNPNDSDEQW